MKIGLGGIILHLIGGVFLALLVSDAGYRMNEWSYWLAIAGGNVMFMLFRIYGFMEAD